jgi:mxaA protein
MADQPTLCCRLAGLLLALLLAVLWALLFALLSALLFTNQVSAQAAIREVQVESPRDYGYNIGDRVVQRVTLSVRDPYRLLRDALPEAGRMDHWLARDPVIVDQRPDQGGIVYRIDLGYRIVNLEPNVEQLTIPPRRLLLGDGQTSVGATVPEWSFRVSWLSDTSRPAGTLQPDRAPPPLEPPRMELGAAGIGLLLALGLLGYRYGRLPFVTRGPFDQALRELRGLPAPWDVDRQRAALRMVHAAFDRLADGTVTGQRLEALFQHQPRLAPLRAAIEDFFARSATVFFHPAPERPPPTRDELLKLCRCCRDALRGVA